MSKILCTDKFSDVNSVGFLTGGMLAGGVCGQESTPMLNLEVTPTTTHDSKFDIA